MSYQYVPSLIRIPKVPGFSPPNGIWRGKGGDEGYVAFNAGSSWGGQVIVRDGNFCPSLQIGGSKLTPVFSDINGYIYWTGNGNVYYTQTYRWVWCDRSPGYEPVENHTFKEETESYVWTGDNFYTLSIPTSPSEEIQMTPRGANKENGEEKTVKAVWPRWVAKNGEFGVYEGEDGESGERVKGIPKFTGAGETFIRSLNKDRNRRFTYGRIHYASGKWVIGEIGSAGGWHEGSEPQVGGGVNFRFCKPEGSDAEGSDISVSFSGYIAGDETDTAYLGSVAIWR